MAEIEDAIDRPDDVNETERGETYREDHRNTYDW
jgi:hypothetical protein